MAKPKPQRLKTGRISAGFKKFVSWSAQNRQKSALLVFSVIFVLGTGAFGVNALINKLHPQHAINTNGEEYATTAPGWWYQQYFGSSTCETDLCKPESDPDHDKLTNQQEFFYNSDPTKAYTVNDPLNDGELVEQGFDPSRPGHVLFTEVLSDDSLIEDGILFDSEVQDIIKQGSDISQVKIPLLDDSKINIVYVDDADAYKKYLDDLTAKLNQYFPASQMESIKNLVEKGQNADVAEIAGNARTLAQDLQTMEVPAKMASFHKYTIAFWNLLPDVISNPPTGLEFDMTDTAANAWYDKAQAFFAVQQRLDFEKQLLSKQFGS